MRERLAALCPFLTGGQLGQFETYYAMLVEWNTRMNLTALTEPAEVAEKHFADSLLPMALVPEGARCIDVGTGAGFPGVPILIARPDIRCVLLDSLNKRLTFLEAVLAELGLSARAKLVHARAEDGARSDALRLLSASATLARYDAPWGERNVILARKDAKTPKEYPRKAGTAAKKPL